MERLFNISNLQLIGIVAGIAFLILFFGWMSAQRFSKFFSTIRKYVTVRDHPKIKGRNDPLSEDELVAVMTAAIYKDRRSRKGLVKVKTIKEIS